MFDRLFCYMQVWAVLKPGFLVFVKDPFDTQPLDIIVFDVLCASEGNKEGCPSLAKEVDEPNPLRHAFKVACSISVLMCLMDFRGAVNIPPWMLC